MWAWFCNEWHNAHESARVLGESGGMLSLENLGFSLCQRTSLVHSVANIGAFSRLLDPRIRRRSCVQPVTFSVANKGRQD